MARKRHRNRLKPVSISWRQRMARPMALLRRVWPGLLLLAAAGVALQQLDSAMAVRGWQVVCDDARLQRAVEMRLKQMAPIGFVAGHPFVLAGRLRALEPDIDAIEVERMLPDRLRVKAKLRQPVALWTGGQGTVVLVDGRGVMYRMLRHGERLDLPMLRVRDHRKVVMLANLLNHLHQHYPQRVASMSELIVRDGLLRINLAQGAQWQCPLDKDLIARVDDIIALLDEERWRHGHWRVDARQQDRWFIRAGNGEREVI